MNPEAHVQQYKKLNFCFSCSSINFCFYNRTKYNGLQHHNKFHAIHENNEARIVEKGSLNVSNYLIKILLAPFSILFKPPPVFNREVVFYLLWKNYF